MYDREAYCASFLKGTGLVPVIKVAGVNSGSGQTLAEMDNGGFTFLDLSNASLKLSTPLTNYFEVNEYCGFAYWMSNSLKGGITTVRIICTRGCGRKVGPSEMVTLRV